MDATCTIQDSIHVFSLIHKYVSRILGTYQKRRAFFYRSLESRYSQSVSNLSLSMSDRRPSSLFMQVAVCSWVMSPCSRASASSSRSMTLILPEGYMITSARRSVTVRVPESWSASKSTMSQYQYRRVPSAW